MRRGEKELRWHVETIIIIADESVCGKHSICILLCTHRIIIASRIFHSLVVGAVAVDAAITVIIGNRKFIQVSIRCWSISHQCSMLKWIARVICGGKAFYLSIWERANRANRKEEMEIWMFHPKCRWNTDHFQIELESNRIGLDWIGLNRIESDWINWKYVV